MPILQVEDTQTGKVVKFDWQEDREPTQSDLLAVFAENNRQPDKPAPPSALSFMDRNRANFDRRIDNANRLRQNPNMTGVERAIGNAGQGWGMVSDIPMEMFKSGASVIPDAVKTAATEAPIPFLGGQSLKQMGQSAAPVFGAMKQGYDWLEQAAPRATNVLDAAGNAANLGGVLSAINPAAKAVGPPMRDAALATKQAILPKPTSEEALRQILQAARGQRNPVEISKNVAAGERALNRLDLKGVNTYEGIRKKLDEAIPELAKSVDDELLKDANKYPLRELTTEQPITQSARPTPAEPAATNLPKIKTWEAVEHPSGGGFAVKDAGGDYLLMRSGHPQFYPNKIDAQGVAEQLTNKAATTRNPNPLSTALPEATSVKVNFVEDALNHLSELYGKIGDKGKATDAANLLKRAEREGLSKKEVNDIARRYNAEFGDKAFGKTGEPLTSVNAQHYETVRRGVKEVARRDMPPEVAELDSMMSDAYRTKKLIARNEAAVQQLKDTVKARGLGEKLGRNALVFADLVTMGVVKGAVLKLIPRGLGYKTMNWMDLEESLTRNLKILEAANKAKTNAETMNILKQSLPPKTP